MLLHERNIYFRVLPEIKTNIGKLLDKKHTLQWGCLEDGFLISNHMESIMSLLQVSLLPALHESALTVRNLCAFVPERTAFREAINNAAVLKRCFQVWEFGFGIGTKGGGAGHSSEVWGERGRWRRRGRGVAKFVGSCSVFGLRETPVSALFSPQVQIADLTEGQPIINEDIATEAGRVHAAVCFMFW